MVNIILYTTHCPKCNVLSQKLKNKGISFIEVTDENEMISLGIKQVPMLKVDNTLMTFVEANAYVNSLKNN